MNITFLEQIHYYKGHGNNLSLHVVATTPQGHEAPKGLGE